MHERGRAAEALPPRPAAFRLPIFFKTCVPDSLNLAVFTGCQVPSSNVCDFYTPHLLAPFSTADSRYSRLSFISAAKDAVKMAATSPSIPQLFTELDRFAKDGNYAKAHKIANKSKRNYSSILMSAFFNFD